MSRRCPCTQVCSGVIVTAGCVYAALWSPVFLGAPFGALLAGLPDSMTPALAAWAAALVYGVQRVAVGVAQNIRDRHGANIWWSSMCIAVAAYGLRVHRAFLLDMGEMAQLAAGGLCIAVIAGHAANLVMGISAAWRSRNAIRRMRARPRLAQRTEPPTWRDVSSGNAARADLSVMPNRKHQP